MLPPPPLITFPSPPLITFPSPPSQAEHSLDQHPLIHCKTTNNSLKAIFKTLVSCNIVTLRKMDNCQSKNNLNKGNQFITFLSLHKTDNSTSKYCTLYNIAEFPIFAYSCNCLFKDFTTSSNLESDRNSEKIQCRQENF